MSLRDIVLAADDLQESVEDIPEWGVQILFKGMTGRERIRLVERVSATGPDREFMYSDIIIATALDPDTGKPAFDPADREALADKSGGVLERLAAKVMELSGVSIDDAEKEVAEDPTSAGS